MRVFVLISGLTKHLFRNSNDSKGMSKKKKTIKPVYKPGIISDEVKDFSKDPFIIKKNEMAIRMVGRVGFPEEFIKKK